MRIKLASLLGLAALLAWSQGGLSAQSAPEQEPRAAEAGLRVLTISYGELVPVSEVEGRREVLIRQAFREGRVRLELQGASGARTLAPGDTELRWALGGSPPESPTAALEPALGIPDLGAASDPDDYDGDGFSPAEEVPPLRGEYVVDLPRISIDFVATIEPGIVAKKTGTETTEEYSKTYSKNTREEKYNASSSQEFKNSVKGSLSATFGNPLKLGLFKFISIVTPKLDATSEYSRTRAWSRSVSTEVQRYMEEYLERKRTSVITVEPTAGFLRSQLLLTNVTHFPAPLRINGLRAQAVAYSPRTGDKFAFGEILLDGDVFLYSGTGNNTATRYLEFTGINTLQMESALYEGYMFDFDISGDYQMKSVDGLVDWRVRKSEAAAKSAWLQVNYGDQNFPVIRQVALQARAGGELTVEKGLVEIFGAQNVTFGFDPVLGRWIVTRVNHRQNRHADRDFNTLTPQEQAEYGRWVIGYRFGSENFATDLLIDQTPLRQDDVVALYFLTREDMIPPPAVPDASVSFDLPAQGQIDNGGYLALEGPVKVGDVVEIDTVNRFTVYRQVSRYYDRVSTWNCGLMVHATCYGRAVDYDTTGFVPVPSVDWYGLKLSFGTSNPRTWLSPGQVGASVVQKSDFPQYSFKVRFTVTAAHLNNQPQGVLRVGQQVSTDTLLRDCRGWTVAGNAIDCTGTWAKELRSVTGQSRWYIYTPDADTDGFTALYHYGQDWDDYDFTVHPGAPELWDGKDNDQDGRIERVAVSGPGRLARCEMGTYRAAPVDFDGALSYTWSRRESMGGGKTPWVTIGTGPTVTARMTCGSGGPDDFPDTLTATAVPVAPMAPPTGFDLRVEASSSGSSYRSVATLGVVQYTPPPCKTRPCLER